MGRVTYLTRERPTQLCVCGRHSLDEMEAMVRPRFSDVAAARGARQQPERFLELPFAPAEHEGLLVKMVPTRASRSLSLQWRVASETDNYRAAPCSFVGHLVRDLFAAASLSASVAQREDHLPLLQFPSPAPFPQSRPDNKLMMRLGPPHAARPPKTNSSATRGPAARSPS